MAVIYKLMDLGHGIGQWPTLRAASEEVPRYLELQAERIEALRLVGYLTSEEKGAEAVFSIAGPEISGYLSAATAVLAPRSEADAAAHAVAGLPQAQRRAILDLLQPAQRRRVESLLEHARPVAGQLMSPEFLCLYGNQTVSDATDRIRITQLPDEVTARVFVVDSHQRLEGAVTLAELLRANPSTSLSALARFTPAAREDTALEALANLMAEHDTTLIPIIDNDERPSGIVNVDDVLEILLPNRWSR